VTKILLAEDEEILRMLIVDTLEDNEYQIDEAADGEEALGYLEKSQYDLIILDYMMPIYTGLEVIEKVRKNGINQNTKILMLSAKNQQTEQERVLGAGAEYFMSKPFSPLQLLEKVEEILNGQ
jgi:CheY-like chemotaxis protein